MVWANIAMSDIESYAFFGILKHTDECWRHIFGGLHANITTFMANYGGSDQKHFGSYNPAFEMWDKRNL